MRPFYSRLAAVGAAAAVLSALFTCCRRASSGDDVQVSHFKVHEVIMAADRNYRVICGGDTAYLDKYASLHWPESMGGADIATLRDSILSLCFADTTVTDPAKAISRFITDMSDFEDADADPGFAFKVERIDSFPEDMGGQECWFANVSATVLELNEEMVTYQIATTSYMGGAHPDTEHHPFTYDFASARVLTADNMVRPECRDSVMPVIVKALARQLDVPVSRLGRAGIFTSQLTYPGLPYIYNNVLYFHYNPYEIAPYSAGMFDIAVYPYEIQSLLTPGARRLFDLGFNQ